MRIDFDVTSHYGEDLYERPPRSPGWPPEDWPFLNEDPFNLIDEIRKKRLCKSWESLTVPHAAYESILRAYFTPEEKIKVKSPGGEVEFTKEELLELAAFPSEIAGAGLNGPWYSSFCVLPGIAESVRSSVRDLHEFVIPNDLAIRYLKHCCTDQTEFQIRNDGAGATYSRNDLYALLYASSRRILTMRSGDGIEFCQEPVTPMPDADIMNKENWFAVSEAACPAAEACIKAKRWPHETAEVLTKTGCIEVSREALAGYAHHPADIRLIGSRWFADREGGLPTMESVVAKLREMKNGADVGRRLAIDYAKLTGNFDVIEGFMNAGTPLMLGLKMASPRHPDDPFIEFRHNPGYSM